MKMDYDFLKAEIEEHDRMFDALRIPTINM